MEIRRFFGERRRNPPRQLQLPGGILKPGEYRLGDIIFWDNTWDRNGNKRFGDDPLTHAGIVISIDEDGQYSICMKIM
jgi:hypothetical protein